MVINLVRVSIIHLAVAANVLPRAILLKVAIKCYRRLVLHALLVRISVLNAINPALHQWNPNQIRQVVNQEARSRHLCLNRQQRNLLRHIDPSLRLHQLL